MSSPFRQSDRALPFRASPFSVAGQDRGPPQEPRGSISFRHPEPQCTLAIREIQFSVLIHQPATTFSATGATSSTSVSLV